MWTDDKNNEWRGNMNGEKLAINEVEKTVLIEFMDARGIGFLTGFWAG